MVSMKTTRLKTAFIAWILLLLPAWTAAEVIHLKDGTTIKVSKSWEEGGWVKFYLEDYDGIVITYARDIIDRIESNDGRVLKKYSTKKQPKAMADAKQLADKAKPATPKPNKSKPTAPSTPVKSAADKPLLPQPAPTPSPVKATTAPVVTKPAKPPISPVAIQPQKASTPPATQPNQVSQPPKATTAVAPALAPAKASKPARATAPIQDEFSAYEGMLFYNPRRDYKYWSGPNTRHHTLGEAVAALAEKFDRTPEWVQQHLGETNNLAQIYRNLSHKQVKIQSTEAADTLAANGLLFYDPRRQYKFHLGDKLKFRNLDEAAAALGRQYDRSSEWVKQHLGETNNVGEIHQNLARAKAAESK